MLPKAAPSKAGGPVDRHVSQRQRRQVQVGVRVSRIDHGVLDAGGVVLGIKEQRARPRVGCST